MELTKDEKIVLEIIKRHNRDNKIFDGLIRFEVVVVDPLGKKGAGIRRVINSLRQKGYAICSDSNGYWYAQSKTELLENAAALRGRAIKIINAAQGMERAAEVYDEMQDKLL